MKRHFSIQFILVIALILFSQSGTPHTALAAGKTYYVSTTGSNNNDGSLARPWLTLQYAANKLVAGDTLYVRGGVYNEKLYVGTSGSYTAKSGTSGSPITYAAYPGEQPIIDGAQLGTLGWGGLVTVYNVSYVTISGFEIRNNLSQKGICVFGNSSNLLLSGLKIHDCQMSGIYIETSTNFLIDGCEVYKTNRIIDSNEQVSLLGCSNFEIKNCSFHNSGKNSLDLKNGCSNGLVHHNEIYGTNDTTTGIYLDCNGKAQDNFKIYSNKIHDCIGPAIVLGSETSPYPAVTNVDIYNNLLYNNNTGFAVWAGPFTRNFRIINNTFYKNKAEIAIYGTGSNAGVNSNCIIRNNVIVAAGEYLIYYAAYNTAGTITIDHNLYYDTAGSYRFEPASMSGANYIKANPLLKNPMVDFGIPSSSPAKNAGSSLNAPASDYIGTIRPQGGVVDIGAYESIESSSTPVTTYSLTISPSEGGTTNPLAGTENIYNSGQLVSIVATPSVGYRFMNWTGDTTTMSNVNSATTTITMNSNYTVRANFAVSTFTLTYAAGNNGKITGTTPQTVNYNSNGTAVSATPNAGYHFANWSDGSTANPRTDSNVKNNISVTANFAADSVDLITNVNGSGTIVKEPDKLTYTYGTSVKLTAVPASGWTFAGWSGALIGTTNPQSITMDADKTVTATFTQQTYNLTVGITGSGSVTRSYDGPYEQNEVVTLTAKANSGWSFAGWSGDLSGASNPHSVTLDRSKMIVALFTQNTFTLSVKVSGAGIVNKNPDQNSYKPGTVVQLTAEPDSSFTFGNWSGDLSGSMNPQSITIDSDKAVVANFINSASTGGSGAFFGGTGTVSDIANYSGPGITGITNYTNNEGKFNIPANIKSDNGKVELTIEKGVIAKDKDNRTLRSISIIENSENASGTTGIQTLGPVYDLGPDGTVFEPGITLSFNYEFALIPQGFKEQNLVVGYWDPAAQKWVKLLSTVDTNTHSVSTNITHFSRYTLLAQSRPADFVISDLIITPQTSQVDDPVVVQVNVENQGDLSGDVELVMNVSSGDKTDTVRETVQLSGGANRVVEFPIRQQTAGTYQISIGEMVASLTVKPAPTILETSEVKPAIKAFTISPNVDEQNRMVDMAIAYQASNETNDDLDISVILRLTRSGEPAYESIVATSKLPAQGTIADRLLYEPQTSWVTGTYTFILTLSNNGVSSVESSPKSFDLVVESPAVVNWYVLLVVIGTLLGVAAITSLAIIRRRGQLERFWMGDTSGNLALKK